VLFLAVMLQSKFDRATVEWVMKVMAVISTVYSVVSVEAATLGFSQKLLVSLLPAYRSVHTGFETGTRLTGILGNANILSSIVAFGILFSICLWCAEENGKRRLIWAGVAAVNAFTFLLLFSMGGTACFVVAVVLYLIFAGKGRGGALVRMLLCALPTLVWVFVAFPFFNREQAVIPLAALIGDILTVAQAGRISREFPQVEAVMIGRGLIADPGMLSGGSTIGALKAFMDEMLAVYTVEFGGARNAMFRLKENWGFLHNRFEGCDKLWKRLRKTTDAAEFTAITDEIFATLPLKKLEETE